MTGPAAWVRGRAGDQGVGGSGVVGVLRNGESPAVLLRAEMDALPVREATGLPYSRMVGVRYDLNAPLPPAPPDPRPRDDH